MRHYVETLMQSGRVRIVEREVDGRFELSAVAQASQRESDLPILFRRVKGSRFPVVTNVFGSRPRLCAMIGADDGAFCRRWAERMRGPAAPFAAHGAADDVEPVRLLELPQLTYFEKDAGSYISAGVFLAKDPETGVPNLSFHRAQVISDQELRVRLGTSHDLLRYQKKAEARNQALEAAILIGAPPAFMLAAAAPIATDESELDVAARLSDRPVPMRRCEHVDLEVPAETEIVIEGRILPNELRPEGPFGEFMGFYVPEGKNHVFEVLAVTVRRGAYYHGLLCGSPEDMRLLELAVATRVYQRLAETLPGIIDVSCVPTVMSTVVKIRQMYDGHARQALITAFGAHHDWSKSCIVVDEDVDINDFDDVYWAFLTRARADQRVMVLPGVPGFYRDPHKDYWGRLGIDATVPFDRKDEFLRKRIPGAERIDLKDYLT